jgi:putative glutamine amidotransferase
MSALIGVSSSSMQLNSGTAISKQITFVNEQLLECIYRVKGIPILIPNMIDFEKVPYLVNKLDGLILSGGQDISPTVYNQKQKVNYINTVDRIGSPFHRPNMIAPNLERDRTELSLYKYAKKISIPVLGICRGMQLINVAEGGTLHQELPSAVSSTHEWGAEGEIPYHSMQIRQGSIAHSIFKTEQYMTSSTHHQAIDKLGNNLVVSGVADDGIVEIIESKIPTEFIFGMQGHPEKAWKQYPKYDDLFNFFIEACQRKKTN